MAVTSEDLSTTATGRLVRRYMARRGVPSARELARRIGKSPAPIRFILSGTMPNRPMRYLGLRPFRAGEEPLLMAIVRELEIPDREVRKALASDLELSGRYLNDETPALMFATA